MDERPDKPKYKPDLLFWTLALGLIGFGVYLTFIEPLFHGHRRETSPANNCINNLRQIDAAASVFALEHDKTNGEAIKFPDDLTPYIKLTRDYKVPPCPSGGIYRISKVGESPTCSLSNTVSPPHVLP